MIKLAKGTVVLLSSVVLGTIATQITSQGLEAHAQETTVNNFTSNSIWNGIDMDHPAFTNSSEEDLTEQQRQDVVSIQLKLIDIVPAIANEFHDVQYANEIVSNSEKRSIAGMSGKSVGIALKLTLQRIGKRAYNKLAQRTGLASMGLTWGVMNQIADRLIAYGGSVKGAITANGVSNYNAGIAASIISGSLV